MIQHLLSHNLQVAYRLYCNLTLKRFVSILSQILKSQGLSLTWATHVNYIFCSFTDSIKIWHTQTMLGRKQHIKERWKIKAKHWIEIKAFGQDRKWIAWGMMKRWQKTYNSDLVYTIYFFAFPCKIFSIRSQKKFFFSSFSFFLYSIIIFHIK